MCSRIDRDGPGSPWTDDAVYDHPLLRLIRTNFSVRRSTIQSAPAVPAVGAFFWAVENTMGKSGKIIARHLVENHEAYSRLIDSHFGQVSPRARNQMRVALRKPANRFWTEILWPNLLLDAQGQPSDQIDLDGMDDIPLERRPMYVPISDTIRTKGRNHELVVMASESVPDSVQEHVSLFANALRIGFQNDEGDWEQPSHRVVGASYTIFTLEYDPPSDWDRERRLAFLDTQLGWFRKAGTNDLDRPIRPVWDWAAQFSDFRGMCGNWSGHKSVHIHLVFDTAAIMEEFSDLRDQVRPMLTRLWVQMAAEIVRVFPQEVEPDSALRLPEQYRKLPNGVYTIETPRGKTEHLLEIPVGTRVPLLCIWEKLLTRAPARADRAFINEATLKQTSLDRAAKARTYRRQSRIGDMTPEEHAYCSEQFDALIARRVEANGFPRGAGLHKESVWVGRLYANQTDRNPSTIILEDGHRAFVQGGKQPDRTIDLGVPLRVHIGKWRREFSKKRGIPCTSRGLEASMEERPEEQQFAAAAISQGPAREALAELLARIIDQHERVLLRAPEGLGKTTAIAGYLPVLSGRLEAAALEKIPQEEKLLRDVERRRPSAFAFSSYELAEEKAAEFNLSSAGRRMRGIVFPSFSRAYEEARKALGIDEIMTVSWAAKHGHDSVAAAIREGQPSVWAEMARAHRALFEIPRGPALRPSGVVYFVVHQVLQQLSQNLLTAALLHPRFFDTAPKEWWQLTEEIQLRVAVLDEIPVEALVWMHRADQVEWCLDLFEQMPDAWSAPEAGLVDKYSTYEAKRAGGSPPVTFEEALEIYRVGYRRADQTEVAECEFYGRGDIYRRTHGRRWYSRKRNWWDGVAQRAILLTTEALPSQMARDIAEIAVFDLRAPELRAGTIQLRLWPSCSSEEAVEIVGRLRAEADDPSLHVITNRAAAVEDTSTHAGARGSNRYVGQNLGQTAFYKSPDEYERLQVINRVFGLNAAIRLRHVDEINQTAGRNLGFRHDGSVEHHLVIGWSLYGEIERVLYAECRYELTLIEDAERRRRNTYTSERALWRGVIAQAEEERLIREE